MALISRRTLFTCFYFLALILRPIQCQNTRDTKDVVCALKCPSRPHCSGGGSFRNACGCLECKAAAGGFCSKLVPCVEGLWCDHYRRPTRLPWGKCIEGLQLIRGTLQLGSKSRLIQMVDLGQEYVVKFDVRLNKPGAGRGPVRVQFSRGRKPEDNIGPNIYFNKENKGKFSFHMILDGRQFHYTAPKTYPLDTWITVEVSQQKDRIYPSQYIVTIHIDNRRVYSIVNGKAKGNTDVMTFVSGPNLRRPTAFIRNFATTKLTCTDASNDCQRYSYDSASHYCKQRWLIKNCKRTCNLCTRALSTKCELEGRQCRPDGTYQMVQCFNGHCFCVDTYHGLEQPQLQHRCWGGQCKCIPRQFSRLSKKK